MLSGATAGYCFTKVTLFLTILSTFIQYLSVNCQMVVLFSVPAAPVVAGAGLPRLPDNFLILILSRGQCQSNTGVAEYAG